MKASAAPVLAGAVFWASETPDENAAPPNNPAVPLNKIQRDRDCRRTVASGQLPFLPTVCFGVFLNLAFPQMTEAVLG